LPPASSRPLGEIATGDRSFLVGVRGMRSPRPEWRSNSSTNVVFFESYPETAMVRPLRETASERIRRESESRLAFRNLPSTPQTPIAVSPPLWKYGATMLRPSGEKARQQQRQGLDPSKRAIFLRDATSH